MSSVSICGDLDVKCTVEQCYGFWLCTSQGWMFGTSSLLALLVSYHPLVHLRFQNEVSIADIHFLHLLNQSRIWSWWRIRVCLLSPSEWVYNSVLLTDALRLMQWKFSGLIYYKWRHANITFLLPFLLKFARSTIYVFLLMGISTLNLAVTVTMPAGFLQYRAKCISSLLLVDDLRLITHTSYLWVSKTETSFAMSLLLFPVLLKIARSTIYVFLLRNSILQISQLYWRCLLAFYIMRPNT